MIAEGAMPLGVWVIAAVDTVGWIEVCSTFWDLCVGFYGHGMTGLPDILWIVGAGMHGTLECLGC